MYFCCCCAKDLGAVCRRCALVVLVFDLLVEAVAATVCLRDVDGSGGSLRLNGCAMGLACFGKQQRQQQKHRR